MIDFGDRLWFSNTNLILPCSKTWSKFPIIFRNTWSIYKLLWCIIAIIYYCFKRLKYQLVIIWDICVERRSLDFLLRTISVKLWKGQLKSIIPHLANFKMRFHFKNSHKYQGFMTLLLSFCADQRSFEGLTLNGLFFYWKKKYLETENFVFSNCLF